MCSSIRKVSTGNGNMAKGVPVSDMDRLKPGFDLLAQKRPRTRRQVAHRPGWQGEWTTCSRVGLLKLIDVCFMGEMSYM